MTCTYPSTFLGEAELVHVSTIEAQSWYMVSISVRQLSHALCDHESGVLGCVGILTGRWLTCISWSMHCGMATAALEIIIVRCVLLTWDGHWGHSAKSAGGRLQLNTHTPYVRGFAWRDMVHGCMVYTERAAKMAAFSCGTSHASAVSTPFRWIFKACYKKLFTHVE